MPSVENKSARQLLNERAMKRWHQQKASMLTYEYIMTRKIADDQRWVCVIRVDGEVVSTSAEEHTNQLNAREDASSIALTWMDQNQDP